MSVEKHIAVWNENSVSTLLSLYKSKLGLLTTPRKKTRIWIAISDNLRDYNIEMTPDQVRWKINALTKQYKQSIDSGQENRFRYFTELNNINNQYNINYYKISEQRESNVLKDLIPALDCGVDPEGKAIIELRKKRLANKIESDKSQSKLQLEKQWLEYLKRQEEQQLLRDEKSETKLKLREEKLKLQQRQIKMREAIELKKMQLIEKEQEEIIKIEKDKCDMLKKIFP